VPLDPLISAVLFLSNSRMVYLRYRFALLVLSLGLTNYSSRAQSLTLPDAPAPASSLVADSPAVAEASSSISLADPSFSPSGDPSMSTPQATQNTDIPHDSPRANASVPVDTNGNPIPLNRQQPTRILGFMPNFRTVSAGAAVHPPGWKYNFTIATHQATDYSTWRGFLDKTDGTYLSAWLLPSILHEDTRYYPLGSGHSIFVRSMYVISRQAVSRTYSEHNTPAFATLGGKALTQYISRFYYPSSSEGFSVLATKFSYSVMRDVGFSAIREFYPDIAAHYIRKHREKVAVQAALDAHPTTP
jgi:hypothetical protein